MSGAYYLGKYCLLSAFAIIFLIGLLATDWQTGRSPFMEHPLVMAILGVILFLLGAHHVYFATRYAQDWFNHTERMRQRWVGRLFGWSWWWRSLTELRILAMVGGAGFALVGVSLLILGLNRLS
jgi:hypothetical protein